MAILVGASAQRSASKGVPDDQGCRTADALSLLDRGPARKFGATIEGMDAQFAGRGSMDRCTRENALRPGMLAYERARQ